MLTFLPMSVPITDTVLLPKEQRQCRREKRDDGEERCKLFDGLRLTPKRKRHTGEE